MTDSEASEKKLTRIERLKNFVKELPQTSGVYLMKNKVEKIIYVGKAKNLRSRVRSYFGATGGLSPKTILLVGQIDSISYILTETEVEAFLLEASLIKKHRPRYNIRLKDDKSYPYIRLSMADQFPRLYLSRKVKNDGSLYFGPYTSGWAVHDTIRFLNKTYLIRDCKDTYFKSRRRPCMTHQIGRCEAPCMGLITEEKYSQDVSLALNFLRGEEKKIIPPLQKKMKALAKEEHFERAAKVRDSIEAIKAILAKQAVISPAAEVNQDVIGFHGDERGTLIETLHVRQGRVIGNRSHFIPLLNVQSAGEDVREWMVSFTNQYYLENFIPDEVLLPIDIGRELTSLLEEVLEKRSNIPVKVRFATDPEGQRLNEMVDKNAKSHFSRYVSKSEEKIKGLETIAKKLHLSDLPRRIECFDISTFQGSETVASQVVFEDGVPCKDEYRRYKIKTVAGTDDFAAMKEVLTRRFNHPELDDPDLIVIDGGKGQLNIACKVLEEIKRPELPVVGLAKARTKGSFDEQELTTSEERFFLPKRQNPVVFANNSEAFRILVGIRDEAHRFAITFHRKLREATSLESELDAVHGLGEKRKKELLTHFQSVNEIRQAKVEEIAALKGFSASLAERLLLELNDEESGSED